MPAALQLPAAIALGYLLGSIPFAWLIVRVGFGLDLRQLGSKNVGATNASRVAGQGRRGVAIAVFLSVFVLDAAKGLGAVALAGVLAPTHPHAPVLAGTATILGHAFPVWLRFRGGKSVATSLGVFAWLAPLPTAVAVGVFVALLATVRIVSVGSIAAAVALPLAQVLRAPGDAFAGGWAISTLCIAAAVFVIVKHRTNIGRLLAGTEGRIGDPPEPGELRKA